MTLRLIHAVVAWSLLIAGCSPSSSAPSSPTTTTRIDSSNETSAPSSIITTTRPPEVSTSEPEPESHWPGLIDQGWSVVAVPESVRATSGVGVATDDELIFWGGEDSPGSFDAHGEPGWAYSPTDNRWRELPPSPKPASVRPAGVWTGEEVIICCGSRSNVVAAYSPEDNSWRTLPVAPLQSETPSAIWSGEEMLLVADGGVAALNPQVGEWRTLPQPPSALGRLNELMWTGSELMIWPSDIGRDVRQGLVLNPETDQWLAIPEPTNWPARPSLAWTGQELIIWGALPASRGDDSERAVGSRWQPDTGVWTPMSEVLPEPVSFEGNIGSQSLAWYKERAVVSSGSLASGLAGDDSLLLAYQPSTDRWEALGTLPAWYSPQISNVGDHLIIVGGSILYVSPAGWQPSGETMPETSQ